MRRGLHLVIATLACGVLAIAPGFATADPPLPLFDGTMSFAAIQGPLDPEEFSWEVELSEDQELQLVNHRTAAVYYTEGHHLAVSINATAAHDAVGSSVPTSLEVSAGNVITLVVHHRAGNPSAGGTPFVYPIAAGEGWPKGFFTTVRVQGPPSELQSQPVKDKVCLVPKLRGRTLRGSKRRLAKANCKIGNVRKRKGANAKASKVVSQNPKPGSVLPQAATVNVTLGSRVLFRRTAQSRG